MIKANWTSSSAFNLELALDESRDWIERVVGEKFKSDNFQESLKDGILLCKLINQIKPGSVNKINLNPSTDFSKRENLALFIKAAKNIGLRDTQLFESQDLFESKRIRNVAISLYWLGRAARSINTYKGPQLNLLKFQGLNCSKCKTAITNDDYLTTMTSQYHTSCAVCCNCNCKLDPKKKFYQESNNFWCENCMVGATSLGNSNSAGKPSSTSGKNAHNNDNQCAGCFGSLEKGYVPDDFDKSKKYCTTCICDLCHEPLIGNFQVKDGKKVCSNCTCQNCSKTLEDGYHEDGLARLCEPCATSNLDDKNKNKAKPCHSGDGHDHSGHSHNKQPTSTTNNTNNNKKDGCRICEKPVSDKPKKHGDDRDKYCTPHENEGCCGKCNKELNGPAVGVMGKNFHPNCFNCDKCNKKLTQADKIKKSPTTGNPLCGPCGSSNSNSKNCHDCKKPISGGSVEALDRPYHPNCFKCHSCDKVLNEDFQEIDNEAFCNPCSKSINQHNSKPTTGQQGSPFIKSGWKDSDRCVECSKPLSGEVAKIFDTFYHKGCFKCQDKSCKASLLTGYFPHNKLPYCRGCSTKIQESSSTEVCQKCNKKIVEGSIVKSGEKLWHKACYTPSTTLATPVSKVNCTKCKSPITGDQVVRQDQKDYCSKCAPPSSTTTVAHGERLNYGMRVDPRSGKRTENQARD